MDPPASRPAGEANSRRESVAEEGRVLFGRCLHPQPEGGSLGLDYQEYCWIEGDKLKNEKQMQMVLDAWGLDPPNLIIDVAGGFRPHPMRLLGPECFKNPELTKAIEGARAVSRFQKSGTNPDANETADDDATLLKDVSSDLYRQVLDAMVALVEACAQTNSWLSFQDTCFSAGIGTIPAFFVEKALNITSARPVILARASFTEELLTSAEFCDPIFRTTKAHRPEQDEAWDLLRQNAQPLPSSGDTEGLPIVELPSKLFHGTADDWPVDTKEYVICHNYGQWMFRAATHYIFSRSSSPFPNSWLGPAGCLFVAAGAGDDELLFNCIRYGTPAVVFKHTGRTCDFFGWVCEAILHDGKNTVDDVITHVNSKYPFWYNDAGELFNVYGLKQNMYKFISGIIERKAAAPAVLSKRLLIVNAIADSPEQILSRLSKCFSDVSNGSIAELGNVSTEVATVTQAWDMHAILRKNTRVYRKRALGVTYSALILSFFSTVVAVAETWLTARADEPRIEGTMNDRMWFALRMLVIFLPAIAGLMVTLSTRLRYTSKWAALFVARTQLESEIYRFRAKSGAYDSSSLLDQKDAFKSKRKARRENSQSSSTIPAKRVRDLFAQRASRIFTSCVEAAFMQDALEVGDAQTLPTIHPAPRAHEFKDKDISKADEGNPLLENGEGDDFVDFDDHVSLLSAEDYFHHRLQPTLKRFREQAPALARRMHAFEITIFVVSLAGTMLAACQLADWVPITVALGALLSSLLQFLTIQSRLTAINIAICDLSGVVSHWHSLGVMEKRTRSVKNFMVDVVENAIVAVAIARVAGAASFKPNSTEEDETDKDDDKQKVGKKDK